MIRRASYLVPLVLAGLFAPVGTASARRPVAVIEDQLPESEGDVAQERVATSAAGAPMMIRPPHPPPPVTQADMRAALTRARTDIVQCLPRGGRATVRARLSDRDGTVVRVSVVPRSDDVETCVHTAATRWLLPLELRGRVVRTIAASMTYRAAGTTPPPNPPVPPPNPPPATNQYDEGLVHASLDRQRAGVLRCLPAASTSTPGDITLRLSVRTDGSMQLEGASLPSGVGGGPVLACLSGLVASTRVPSPPTTRSVTHIVTLGR